MDFVDHVNNLIRVKIKKLYNIISYDNVVGL